MPMASAPPARKASQKQSRFWRRSSPPPWGCAASTLSTRSTITCWRCETNGEAEQLARYTLSPCGRGWRELSKAKFEPGEGLLALSGERLLTRFLASLATTLPQGERVRSESAVRDPGFDAVASPRDDFYGCANAAVKITSAA